MSEKMHEIKGLGGKSVSDSTIANVLREHLGFKSEDEEDLNIPPINFAGFNIGLREGVDTIRDFKNSTFPFVIGVSKGSDEEIKGAFYKDYQGYRFNRRELENIVKKINSILDQTKNL